ncbi:MAG TPA: ATP-binding protein [Spirochaetota bacterium]|nr:ATP-binding protein [Spirochaetota bacterium]HOL57824.1 ATP-binding protein [Spirochaetota bacterium]HPP05346.1 ATP-binding protein [Spirochaetota bacterium]
MLNNKKLLKLVLRNIPLLISFSFWCFISFFLIGVVNRVFKSKEDEIIEKEVFLIAFLVILSIILFIFIVIYIVRLFILAFKKEFGSRIKLKITLLFVFVALLPIIPFIQIGTKFIESSMNIWFSENIGMALDYSEEIIKSYYKEKKDILIQTVNNLNKKIKNNNIRFEEIANLSISENIKNISIWSDKGELLGFKGEDIFNIKKNFYPDTIFKDKKIMFDENKENIFTIEKENRTFLIIPAKIIDIENNTLLGFLNIAIEIFPYFNKVTKELDNSLRNYNIVSLYKNFFTVGFIILFIAVLFPIIIIVFLISIFISNELIEPISNLATATKRIAAGDLNFSLESSFTDEFRILTDYFNSMIGEIELSKNRLQQREKIQTWQEIAKRLAHELKNPLTPIRLSSERILKKYNENDPYFKEILNKGINTIINEVDRLNQLLIEFSNFARLPNTNLVKGGIIQIIKKSVDLFSANPYNIRINLFAERDWQILRDELQLKSVFDNLLTNAIESMQKEGEIEISFSEKRKGFTNYLVIKIKDQGCGINKENGIDIFQPYFSMKKDNEGLGLSISQKIISEHNGIIYFESEPDKGTTFFIELPLAD